MMSEKTIVIWRNGEEKFQDVFETSLFIQRKGSPLKAISAEEYTKRYTEIFNQYCEETK